MKWIGELLVTVIIFVLFLGFRAWLAGGDTKCFFARDPAVCAAIKDN